MKIIFQGYALYFYGIIVALIENQINFVHICNGFLRAVFEAYELYCWVHQGIIGPALDHCNDFIYYIILYLS